MAVAMSQLNPEPRPSMAFMPPIRALAKAYGGDGAALMAALGVEEVPYGELLLGAGAVSRAPKPSRTATARHLAHLLPGETGDGPSGAVRLAGKTPRPHGVFG